MSIARDLRSYADTAVSQGRQVLDSGFATAQSQLNDVTGQANEFYGKTRENVADIAGKATAAANDLRVSAEKAVNIDAIRHAVEPYLVQVKGYTTSVTDRAEVLYAGLREDKRVAQLLDATRPVVEAVQVRVIKPVVDLTGLGSKPAPAAKPAPRKAAATRPASKPAAAKKTASKPAAKKTARKASPKTAPTA
jgi:hypothetical protein